MSMSMVEHARRELELSGILADDPQLAQTILAVVGVFSTCGHGGASASVSVEILATLLSYGTLAPLTDDPDQWHVVGDQDGGPLWQSRRDPEAFSTDGGKTYYLVSEFGRAQERAARAVPKPMHTAVPHGPRAEGCGQAVNGCVPHSATAVSGPARRA